MNTKNGPASNLLNAHALDSVRFTSYLLGSNLRPIQAGETSMLDLESSSTLTMSVVLNSATTSIPPPPPGWILAFSTWVDIPHTRALSTNAPLSPQEQTKNVYGMQSATIQLFLSAPLATELAASTALPEPLQGRADWMCE